MNKDLIAYYSGQHAVVPGGASGNSVLFCVDRVREFSALVLSPARNP